MEQVGSYLGHSGCCANAVGKAAHRRHGMQHRAGLINEVDRTLGFVRTKANLLVSNLGISVAKLFLDILRAFRP